MRRYPKRFANLRERVGREKSAYDQGEVYEHSAALLTRFSHVFQGPNAMRAERELDRLVAEMARGAVVLEYGCATGWLVPKLVGYGAEKIVGIDVSEGQIAEARKHFGDTAEFHCMDAHRTTFPEGAFDLVLGRAILHHLEYETAVREIHRILKPGGHAVFLEPLRDNPAAKLARRLTPKARTPDETPLSRKQILWADGLFGWASHQSFLLVSAAAGAVTSFVLKSPDNLAMRLSDRMDCLLARTPLRHWMLMVLLVWRKAGVERV